MSYYVHTEEPDILDVAAQHEQEAKAEAEREPDSQELEQVLRIILDQLATGGLKRQQVEELIEIARTILDSLREREEAEAEAAARQEECVTPVMMSQPFSQSSRIAEEIVAQTLSKVKADLLMDEELIKRYQNEAYEMGAPVESLSALAQFIANKVMTSAVHSLQAASEEGSWLWLHGERPSSAPATPDRAKSHLPDLVQEEPSLPLRSPSSDLVWTVLQRTAKEIEAEVMMANPNKQPSEMSAFVRHVICQAAGEMIANATGNEVNWDMSRPSLRPADSKASDISFFVQHTLNKVLGDMEWEGTFARREETPVKNASSLFVEQLLELTLQQCLGEVREELIPRVDLVNTAAAIIESHQGARIGSRMERASPGLTRSLDSMDRAPFEIDQPQNTSSLLVEVFIKETLGTVLNDLKLGNMNAKDVKSLAQAFGADKKMDANDLESSTSVNEFVRKAIEDVMRDMMYTDPEQVLPEPKTAESKDASELLTMAFKDVLGEMQDKSVPMQSKSSQEVDAFVKAILKKANTDVKHPTQSVGAQLTRTRTPAPMFPKSQSSQDLEEFIYDLIDKNAESVANDLGISYTPGMSRKSNSVHSYVDKIMTMSKSSDGMLRPDDLVFKGKEIEARTKSSLELTGYIHDMISQNAESLSREGSNRATPSSLTDVRPSSKSSAELNLYLREVINSATKDLIEDMKSESLVRKDTLDVNIDGLSVSASSNASNTSTEMHIIIDSDHDLHEDSSDEALVEPLIGDHTLAVDHHMIENALSILSVKNNKDFSHIHEYDAVPRNSFMSLQHPHVEKVKRLAKLGSSEDICKRILDLSSRICIEGPAADGLESDAESEESESSVSSLEEETQLGLEENVMSVQNLHDSVVGPDKGPPPVPTAVAMQPSQRSSSSLKQRTSSPYNSKVMTPKASTSIGQKSSIASVTKTNSKSSRYSLPAKSSQTGVNSNVKSNKSQTGQVMSKAKPTVIPRKTSPTKKTSSTNKDQKVGGSFPQMQTRKTEHVTRTRSDLQKVKSDQVESSTKTRQASPSKKVRSKPISTTNVSESSKNNVNAKKSKQSNEASPRNSATKTGRVSSKTSTGGRSDSKLRIVKKDSSKKVVGSTVSGEVKKEELPVRKDSGKVVEVKENKLEELPVNDVTDTSPKEDVCEEPVAETPEEGTNTQARNQQQSVVEAETTDRNNNVEVDDTQINENDNKLEEAENENNEATKQSEKSEKNKKNRTGESPQSQSIEIVSKFSGNLSLNLVEESDTIAKRQGSDFSLKSAPPDVEADREVGGEDVEEEIEEDIQTVRRVSARKSSKGADQYGYTPTMHSSSDKNIKSAQTVEMMSSSNRVLGQKKSSGSTGSKNSLGKSQHSSRTSSHRTVNLTPRPSSGYSKSPTPQVINRMSSGQLREGNSVTSRLMKSISNLGGKLFGRKTPSSPAANVEERNISSPSGQMLTKKESKGSLIYLPGEEKNKELTEDKATSLPTSNTKLDDLPRKGSITSGLSEMSKQGSNITLSPKLSKRSLRNQSGNVNNSSKVNVQDSTVRCTHSDNEEEEELHGNSSAGHVHTGGAGHGHVHGLQHHHTKECPSTGSLPELESESVSIMRTTGYRSSFADVVAVGKIVDEAVNVLTKKGSDVSGMSNKTAITLSPKVSNSRLENVNNSSQVNGQDSVIVIDGAEMSYTHSDNEEGGEEEVHTHPSGHVHPVQHPRPSTGSLPELESQSAAFIARNSSSGVVKQVKSR